MVIKAMALLNLALAVAYSVKIFIIGGQLSNNGIVAYVMAFGLWTIALLEERKSL